MYIRLLLLVSYEFGIYLTLRLNYVAITYISLLKDEISWTTKFISLRVSCGCLKVRAIFMRPKAF